MTTPSVSVILVERRDPQRLALSVQSLLAQEVRAEVVVVVPPAQRSAVLDYGPDLDVVVELDPSRWTLGRALNAGAAAATASIHATFTAGRQLPGADWTVRLLAHLDQFEVAAAAGASVDATHKSLLRALTIRAQDWEPRWGFSASAAGWKAEEWARQPFDEEVPAAADRIWAWQVMRRGALIVLDPYLALSDPPLSRPNVRSIFLSSAAEWKSFVTAGVPVTRRSLSGALSSWWADIDTTSATPAPLQRLNYFRLARALGSWVGSRAARR